MICGLRYIFYSICIIAVPTPADFYRLERRFLLRFFHNKIIVEKPKIMRLIRILETHRNTSFHF
jgi:hypothetical protein